MVVTDRFHCITDSSHGGFQQCAHTLITMIFTTEKKTKHSKTKQKVVEETVPSSSVAEFLADLVWLWWIMLFDSIFQHSTCHLTHIVQIPDIDSNTLTQSQSQIHTSSPLCAEPLVVTIVSYASYSISHLQFRNVHPIFKGWWYFAHYDTCYIFYHRIEADNIGAKISYSIGLTHKIPILLVYNLDLNILHRNANLMLYET